MWRFVFLAALGIVIGSKTRTERGVVVYALLFGLLYGGVEVLASATMTGQPSAARILVLLGLGVVMAAPVYAVAELWRRGRTRLREWLRRRVRR